MGDWVVFAPGYKTPEIGRVWTYDLYRNTCGVCYSHGCTPATTACEMLRAYSPEEFPDLVPDNRIGFHRFDSECLEYDESACGACKQREGGDHA